jgi:hypothetical protein
MLVRFKVELLGSKDSKSSVTLTEECLKTECLFTFTEEFWKLTSERIGKACDRQVLGIKKIRDKEGRTN